MRTVVVAAPCKVNLSLDIVGQRRDGYHELASIMQTVDLYDYLLISRSTYRGIFVHSSREQLVCDTTNTAYRAAEKFFAEAGIAHPAVRIEIIKNIPMQAGLGGGSSDAAAVLVGLNRMMNTGFSQEQLCQMGAFVGADVPFCLRGGTMLCEGIGEQFTELPALPSCHILIAKPRSGLSTKRSFSEYDRRGGGEHPDTALLVQMVREGNLRRLAGGMRNVLESVSDLPEIAHYKHLMLENGALGSVMTGSGSAVIGLFDNKRAARHAQHKLLSLAETVFITRPVGFGARVTEGKR